MERHWTRLSTWLVAFMGVYMLVNTVRATLDPAGFASAMGLPLTDPRCTDGFVPYHSSHLDGVESELIVRSDHHVHDTPEALQEMKRILRLQSFSTEGFRFGNEQVSEDASGRRKTAAFFACHYGFFHFVYFFFLTGMAALSDPTDLLTVLACGLAYALAQRQTFRQQVAADARGRPNLGVLMFLPYLRIVPIHLTIILGAATGDLISLFVFIPLKTVADIALDRLDRRLAEKTILDWLMKPERQREP